ncbi:hypothetical protein A8709_09555 [Paenibacillus pectinilyticus]|uniref:Uncharacterized protein n=1 Tax=Paenibacillus pectinilyticus TaxID=512399 RepID=A0A1C1A5M1_9BACL|nr:hypothetical protein [Paenibacillus pectinilyticus]OCT15862.1 hypothetical protein A8709_09555 [Paenibacillus pectinilyticus]
MYNDPTLYPYPPVHYQQYPAHPYHYAPYWAWDRYPSVDTKMLANSVSSTENLLKDASLLISKLSDPKIAHELMTSAQNGNQKEVDRIIHTFGSKSTIITSFSPSAIQFTMGPHVAGTHPCCQLSLSLKWGD